MNTVVSVTFYLQGFLGIPFVQAKLMMTASRGLMWEGKCQDKSRCYISFRKDRSPILVLYGNKGDAGCSQLCQIAVKYFGDPDAQAIQSISCKENTQTHTHTTTQMQTANTTIPQSTIDNCFLAFKPIALKYAAGELPLEKLYSERDKLVRSLKAACCAG